MLDKISITLFLLFILTFSYINIKMHQKFSLKKSCEYNSPNYSCSTLIKLSTFDLEVHGNLVCRYLQYNTGILSLSLSLPWTPCLSINWPRLKEQLLEARYWVNLWNKTVRALNETADTEQKAIKINNNKMSQLANDVDQLHFISLKM